MVVRTASTNAKLDALQSRMRQAELFVLVLWAVGAGGWLPLLEVVCQVASISELYFCKAVYYARSWYAIWASSRSDGLES